MQRTRSAFTLLELLVSIAIVMLLVVAVAVALKSVRSAAGRTSTLGTLRHMGLAYKSYSADNRMLLMPGYVDAPQLALFEQAGRPLYARRPQGEVLDLYSGSQSDSSSYVWRLAPYVDDAWTVFFDDLAASARSRIQADVDQGSFGPGSVGSIPGGVSERPAFGMNSIFVGGDNYHGGSWVTDRNPWDPQNPDEVIAATRLSEVKSPAKLIVFAPAAMAEDPDDPSDDDVYREPDLGFCELRPPFTRFVDVPNNDVNDHWVAAQWIIGLRGRIEPTSFTESGNGAGLPIDRAGEGAALPVANLDGSAEILLLTDLARDMRRWAPREIKQSQTWPDQGP